MTGRTGISGARGGLAGLLSDLGFDQVGSVEGGLVAGGGRGREVRKPVGERGIVHVGQVVAGGGELLGISVTDVAQRIEAIGDQNGGRKACMGVRVRGRDVRVADVVGIADQVADHFEDAVGLEVEAGAVFTGGQGVGGERCLNTFNLRLHRCKIAVWPELGSRYCKIRAGSETGSRSGCWRRRSPARWWTRRWMPPGRGNSAAGCSRRG